MVAKGVKDVTAPAGALSEGQGTAETPEEQKAEQVGREDEILRVWEGGEDPAGVWARLGCKHGLACWF